jgi:hypothetical protein
MVDPRRHSKGEEPGVKAARLRAAFPPLLDFSGMRLT